MGQPEYPAGMDCDVVSPEQLVAALSRLADVSDRQDRARAGGVKAMEHVKARGHRIWAKGGKVVIAGPAAPQVALEVKDRMARGAVKALRERP